MCLVVVVVVVELCTSRGMLMHRAGGRSGWVLRGAWPFFNGFRCRANKAVSCFCLINLFGRGIAPARWWFVAP